MLISIIIPVYNSEKYIAETIKSVLKQSYRNYEVIIIDDGSTDNSARIINGFRNNCKIITKSNKGRSTARNDGLAVASGEYVLFLDSDDLLEEDALENLYAPLSKGKFPLIYGKYSFINQNSVKVNDKIHHSFKEGKIEDCKSLFSKNFIATPAAMFNRSFLISNKLFFDQDLSQYEDWDLCLRILLNNGEIKFVNKIICKVRIHPSRTSNDVLKMAFGYKNVVEKLKTTYPSYKRYFKTSSIYSIYNIGVTHIFLKNFQDGLKSLGEIKFHIIFLPAIDKIRYFLLALLCYIHIPIHRKLVRIIFGKGCELTMDRKYW